MSREVAEVTEKYDERGDLVSRITVVRPETQQESLWRFLAEQQRGTQINSATAINPFRIVER